MAETPSAPREKMTASDFVLGVTHSAAVLKGGRIGLNLGNDWRTTHTAYASVFDELEQSADEKNIALRFRIRPHYMHGDSQELNKQLSLLLSRQLLESWTQDPILTYDAENLGADVLSELPGTPDLYEQLGKSLLEKLTNATGS